MRRSLCALLLCCCDGVVDGGVVDRVRLDANAVAAADVAAADVFADEGVAVVDLGSVAVVGGVSGDVVADVDEDVRSLTLLVQADDDDVHVVVDRVVVEGGAGIVVSPDAEGPSALVQRLSRGFAGPFLSARRALASQGSGAFVFARSGAVDDGRWRLRVRQGRVDVDASGAVTQTERDGGVHLIGVVDTRVTTERLRLPITVHHAVGVDDAFMAAATATAAAIWADAGVDLDVDLEADVSNVAAEFAVLTLRDDLCEEGALSVMLASLPPTPGALDVVVVDHFECLVRGSVVVRGIAGLTAAVPADAFSVAGRHGGLALAADVVGGDAEFAGVIFAHEVGHALGLFHTVEQASGADPLVFDDIDDTANDAAEADNLMVAAPTTQTTLTPQQKTRARSSPWLAPEL